MTDIEQQWYWDRRIDKAYYPVETDGDAVTFVTARHAEEVEDALECGALVPIAETNLDRDGATFDLIDSFRLSEGPRAGGTD